MSLRLFNTLTREKEEFETLEEGIVRFYSCGQTIYDDLHVGNARAYAVWDTLRRYLEWKGYTVRHVQNITDVGHLTDDGDQGEDKVAKRAQELGLEPMELVEDQIDRYFDDTKAINVNRQDIMPRATGHINEMINYVQEIIENGYAYEVDGSVYFDLEAFLQDYDYAEMANKDIEQLKEEAKARVEHDPDKKNQFDFALWIKADEDHAMKWESPWGEGYPGWHIECSVMSQKYLGEIFDIHAGGKDHIFPHHPNERAQCRAATGEGQARYWLHNEFIQVEGEKMSKSKGNFYTVRELLEDGFSGNAIRLYLVSAHYRSETSFDKEGLEEAEQQVRRLFLAVKKAENSETSELGQERSATRESFEKHMDDDLNTAKAKQDLLEFASTIHDRPVEAGEKDADLLRELMSILGLEIMESRYSDMITQLLEFREEKRAEGSYKEADLIRDILESSNLSVEDYESGTVWTVR